MCTAADCLHGGVLYGGSTSIWNKTLADGSVAVGLVNVGNFGNVGKTVRTSIVSHILQISLSGGCLSHQQSGRQVLVMHRPVLTDCVVVTVW